ncbi:hypothetical protein I316_01584 [Kwoniella heveanensis BCC8398]|uniref:Uncharacterized protein n=1 Tax=Kwoniella heveanensis BCC8398 TaxID=1296120 RepID=A0A1B9H129_9TREE|nr:hypothetical protein I316_01584 [Kwoniella heveanensis BCC8398]
METFQSLNAATEAAKRLTAQYQSGVRPSEAETDEYHRKGQEALDLNARALHSRQQSGRVVSTDLGDCFDQYVQASQDHVNAMRGFPHEAQPTSQASSQIQETIEGLNADADDRTGQLRQPQPVSLIPRASGADPLAFEALGQWGALPREASMTPVDNQTDSAAFFDSFVNAEFTTDANRSTEQPPDSLVEEIIQKQTQLAAAYKTATQYLDTSEPLPGDNLIGSRNAELGTSVRVSRCDLERLAMRARTERPSANQDQMSRFTACREDLASAHSSYRQSCARYLTDVAEKVYSTGIEAARGLNAESSQAGYYNNPSLQLERIMYAGSEYLTSRRDHATQAVNAISERISHLQKYLDPFLERLPEGQGARAKALRNEWLRTTWTHQ